MIGFIEIITLLLGLSGFGIAPNPKAPTPDQSLQYAMPDADVVVHFDAASVVPNNYKALTQLADQPQVKASPDLQKMVRQMVGEVEGGRGLVKTATGIDLASDVTDATVFLQFVPGQKDPNFVAAVRGKFNAGTIDKIAKTTKGTATKIGAAAMIEMGPKAPAIGVTKDGTMIAGTPQLVKDRLADTWKAPARAGGSNLATVADVLNAKPVFAFVLTMSGAARKELLGKIGGKNFATDLIGRHKAASFSIYRDGVGWTWIDSTAAGLENMAMMSEGAVEIMRAAQIAPRGIAKLILGGLDSYKGRPEVDQVLSRKADILKIVDSFTGDGNFKVQVDKDPKTYRLSVRATGKTLSEVLPGALILPGVGAAVMMSARKVKMDAMPPPSPSKVPAVPVRP